MLLLLMKLIVYDVTDESMVCRILLARLEYLRDTFQIKEGDFLTFDALVLFHCPCVKKNNYCFECLVSKFIFCVID